MSLASPTRDHPPTLTAITESSLVTQRPIRVSAVVPVFNEETTVATVVEILLGCVRIDEVVCVNDGSTDRSLGILHRFGDRIILVDLQPNRGKGHALAEGTRKAAGDIVVFFDADLTNLSPEHVAALLEPITTGRARAVLGSPGGDFLYSVASALAPGVADSIGSTFTGERAYFRRDLLPHAARMEATRFGVEVYLNGQFAKTDTIVVALPRLAALGKQDKHGWSLAVKEYSGEMLEVVSEIARTGRTRLGESYRPRLRTTPTGSQSARQTHMPDEGAPPSLIEQAPVSE
jgi:hypothetical protein